MTSMIDVVATLLLVFVVAAPMMTSGVNVDLPVGAHSSIRADNDAVNISIDRQGNLFVGTRSVTNAQFREQMRALREANPKANIVISGDTASRYGRILELMSELKTMGFAQVGLKTTPERR